jgi:hypothetical protein
LRGSGGAPKPPFLPILIYVFGFLLALAALAFALAWLLRR